MADLLDEQDLTFRTIAMPADTNPAGDIFGGWLISQMDLAAFVRSSELSGGRTVTAALTDVAFAKAVKVGDTVCVYTRPLKLGRSSVTLEVQAYRRQARSQREMVCKAVFVMVAVDDAGTPRALPEDARQLALQ